MNRYLNTLSGWTLLTALAWYTTTVATVYLLQHLYTLIEWYDDRPLDQVPIIFQGCFFAVLGMTTVPFLWRKKPMGWYGAFEMLFAYAVFIYLPIAFLGIFLGALPECRIELSPVVIEICAVAGSVSGIWAFFFGAPAIALSAAFVALVWEWARMESASSEESHESPL